MESRCKSKNGDNPREALRLYAKALTTPNWVKNPDLRSLALKQVFFICCYYSIMFVFVLTACCTSAATSPVGLCSWV